MLRKKLVQAGRNELLDAEAKLAFFLVQIKHRRTHNLTDAQQIGGMIETPVGSNFADMNQPFDAFAAGSTQLILDLSSYFAP